MLLISAVARALSASFRFSITRMAAISAFSGRWHDLPFVIHDYKLGPKSIGWLNPKNFFTYAKTSASQSSRQMNR
jgi:hypothetical protein